MKVCPKCNGEGYLKGYSEIKNGICFCCNGTGKVEGEENIELNIKLNERDVYWNEMKEAQKVLIEEIREEYKMIKLIKRSEETRYSLAEYEIQYADYKQRKYVYSCLLNKHGINGLLRAVEKSNNTK